MNKTQSVPPILNRFMKIILRSPIHGMVSSSILLISFTGRKSGKTYTTPVSYSRAGDQLHVFTHASWWKNLRSGNPSGAPVTLRLQGRDVLGLAEPVNEDTHAIANALAAHLRKVPHDAAYAGVTFDENRNPRADEVERAAKTLIMIRIHLC